LTMSVKEKWLAAYFYLRPRGPWRSRYKGELGVTVVGTVVSVVASILINRWLEQGPVTTILYAWGILVVILGFSLLFNQKRLIDDRFGMINDMLVDHFGSALSRDMFVTRRDHFVWEKREMADHLLNTVLPTIISGRVGQAQEVGEEIKTIRIIIDSGTTLTPVFRGLLDRGLTISECPRDVRLEFYTNSFAGIEELHKVRQHRIEVDAKRLYLFGGQPLLDYRACTGDITQDTIDIVWPPATVGPTGALHSGELTIAVITANWFLSSGRDGGINRIALCARGFGHLAFKKKVHAIANYTIVVTPLGKLLRCNLDTLRTLVPSHGSSYQEYALPDERRNTTFLLTTRRDEHQVLNPLTIALEAGMSLDDSNYTLWPNTVLFKPPGLTPVDRYESDTPHKYIRKQLTKAFLIPQPTFPRQ
jgi:hypothetical protein